MHDRLPSPKTDPTAAIDAVGRVKDAFPSEGMFRDKTWRISPEPFSLSPATVSALERLGPVLHRFQKTTNLIYRRSVTGTAPSWVADYLNRGKPQQLQAFGRQHATFEHVPLVIRPDLVLTDNGFAITELDTVPGGIGLTGWLNRTYADLGFADSIIGGRDGVFSGFSSMFPKGADIVISEESSDYRPETEWLGEELRKLDGSAKTWNVAQAESYEPGAAAIYRFFELFDLPNIPFAQQLLAQQKIGDIGPINAPMKAYLDEKLWLALFWSHPLREIWRRELRASNWSWLQQLIPFGWVVDPAPLPHHAVLPRLEAQSFEELGEFSQRERNFVLKISGFSEKAWGSRGVHMAADLSQTEWTGALKEAIDSFPTHPYILQEFHKGRLVEHPWVDEETQQLLTLSGRVRLCPYYFVPGAENGRSAGKPKLAGVMATICPEDKKTLHGMPEAIITPCRVDENGY
ncbi:MAG: hypothetical protein ACI8UO_006147 [Verrucomicrobiales bacterium]|jgi:hypothetical protein